jgi:hypothetical protein
LALYSEKYPEMAFSMVQYKTISAEILQIEVREDED